MAKKSKVSIKNKVEYKLLAKGYNLWLDGFLNNLAIKWLKRQHLS